MNWERKHENVNEERQNRWIKNIPHNELMLVERHTEQRKKCMMELECKTTSENIYVSLKYLCLTAKKKIKNEKSIDSIYFGVIIMCSFFLIVVHSREYCFHIVLSLSTHQKQKIPSHRDYFCVFFQLNRMQQSSNRKNCALSIRTV